MRVRHCSVRAIVDQPWRFGDRDALSRAVTRLAVEVLAARLASQLQRVGQTAGLGRVALHVTLPASVVLDLVPGATAPEGPRLGSFAAELAVHGAASRAVRQALERVALEPAGSAAGSGPGQRPRARPGPGPGPAPGSGAAEPGPGTAAVAAAARRHLAAAAIGRTLLRALESGQLRPLLRRAGAAVVAEWARVLAAVSASPTPPADLSGGNSADPDRGAPVAPPAAVPAGGNGPSGTAAPVTVGPPGPGAGDPTPSGPWNAETLAAVLAGLGPGAETEATLLAAAAREAGLWTDERTPSGPRLRSPSGGPGSGGPGLRRPDSPAPASPPPPNSPALAGPVTGPAPAASGADRPWRSRPARLEVEVASVLPFLLVGPLDELGVLDAVTAALAGTGSSDLQAAFAACLARKVLPAPAHGWFQPDEVAATVAAFTGGEHPPDGSATERLGRAAMAWWPVVEAAVTETRVRLHAPEAPLVLVRSASGRLVLADSDGYLPLLWDGEADDVAGIWERCGRPPVLAGEALAAALPGDLPLEVDEARAAPLAELVALAGGRPAAGRPGLAPELDAPMAELAAVGLATVAWELWRRHEVTHPAMAVGRLGDLDGRVSLERDRVEVRMPLGRRHADLRDSGLLRTVPEVAWLDGRRLELTGG
jgi:hypothetical protein